MSGSSTLSGGGTLTGTFTGGTLNSAFNGTIGATTPNSGAFTTVNISDSVGYKIGGNSFLRTINNSSLFVGLQAGAASGSGDFENTYVGYHSGANAITPGSGFLENTYLGWAAGEFGTTATNRTVVGTAALWNDITSSNIVAIGTDAMRDVGAAGNAAITSSVAIGVTAMRDNNQSFSVAIGLGALAGQFLGLSPPYTILSSGSGNVAIGDHSMFGTASTSTVNNVAVGNNTLYAITNGQNNVSVGSNSGQFLTTGVQNVFIGAGAGNGLTTAFTNVFIGFNSAILANGNNNTAIGASTGKFMTSGVSNVLVGFAAGFALTTGSNNTIIGNQVAGTTLTTGNGNIVIGVNPNADTLSAGANNTMVIQGGGTTPTMLGTFMSGANPVVQFPGSMQVGGIILALAAGEFGLPKMTASGSSPGASGLKLAAVCGTGAGSLKIIAYGGTSATPVTVTDNIGSGVTGC